MGGVVTDGMNKQQAVDTIKNLVKGKK